MGVMEVHNAVQEAETERSQTPIATHRLCIRPIGNPDIAIDLSEALVQAVAHEIWQHVGGNDALNWLEAEQFVQEMLCHVAKSKVPDTSDASADLALDVSKSMPSKSAMIIEPKSASEAYVEEPNASSQLQHAA